MQLNPHLTFNGGCEAAFKYYERCLGGKITLLLPYGDSPMAELMPHDGRNKILHAELALGDQRLTGVDVPPESYQVPQGFSVSLQIGDADEADRVFGTLAEAGAVQYPIQETFWALRFGMVVDRFGTPWMINCGKPPA
jgi:PhnB protein